MDEEQAPAIRTRLGSPKKSKKARANEREEDLAEKIGAFKHANSGAFNRRGDFSLEEILFDSKHSDGASIIVSAKDLVKITSEARGQSKQPSLVLTLGKIAPTVPAEWALLPLEVLSELIEELNDLRKEIKRRKREDSSEIIEENT